MGERGGGGQPPQASSYRSHKIENSHTVLHIRFGFLHKKCMASLCLNTASMSAQPSALMASKPQCRSILSGRHNGIECFRERGFVSNQMIKEI